jgi:hypothetical protein
MYNIETHISKVGNNTSQSKILFPSNRNDSLSNIIEIMIPVPVKISRNPYGENVAKATIRIIVKSIINGL